MSSLGMLLPQRPQWWAGPWETGKRSVGGTDMQVCEWLCVYVCMEDCVHMCVCML